MSLAFLGFEFQRIELSHRDRLAAFLAEHPQPLAGYTFASLAGWNDSFDYQWVFPEPGTLLLAPFVEPGPARHLLQPVGRFSEELQRSLLAEAARLPYRLQVLGVSTAFVEEFPEFAAHFDILDERNGANYVYGAEDLATLAGRQYSKKRNLLAQAAKAYHWTVEPLQPADAMKVLEDVRAEGWPMENQTARREEAALVYTLQHYTELKQQGIQVRVDRRPVAFSIFEPMGPTTAVIHFERALRAYKGLYQVVNREAARELVARGYALINREEDLGDAGLRQAKESYHPLRLCRWHTLTFPAGAASGDGASP